MTKVLSYKLAGELFGIDITYVKEINRNIEYSVVPKSPTNILGLFNMRGQIVTLFNLAKILGYEASESENRSICIILKATQGSANQVGFLIDETGDVLDLEDDTCEVPPANVDELKYKYIKKISRLEKELLMIIDTGKIIQN